MLTIDHLLAHSCSSLDVFDDEGLSSEWNIYVIKLHCVEYRVIAKPVTEGVYDQKKEDWILPPKYKIRSYTKTHM